MEHPFLRNEMLWGPEAQARLARAHVLLLGLGGVGSYAAECLARSGPWWTATPLPSPT